jgi:hypothetical protein
VTAEDSTGEGDANDTRKGGARTDSFNARDTGDTRDTGEGERGEAGEGDEGEGRDTSKGEAGEGDEGEASASEGEGESESESEPNPLEKEIRRIAGDEADKRIAKRGTGGAATSIEIKVPDVPPVTIDGAHYLMPRLLKLLGAGMHVYLWGPAGSGKTSAAMQAAEALTTVGVMHGFELDTLDPTTFKSAIFGYRTPTGEPVETQFTRAYGRGAAYIADECDLAPGQVQTLFNSALANGHAPAAWGAIARAQGFVFVGAGNTPGRPTAAFNDRKPMSEAFKDRLYFLHWPIDENIERRICGLPLVKPPARVERTCTPADWCSWVLKVRAWAGKNAVTLKVTPRASIEGRKALALGETPEEIAHGLVFRGADDELVRKALAACPLP